jgi:hypothetical protein
LCYNLIAFDGNYETINGKELNERLTTTLDRYRILCVMCNFTLRCNVKKKKNLDLRNGWNEWKMSCSMKTLLPLHNSQKKLRRSVLSINYCCEFDEDSSPLHNSQEKLRKTSRHKPCCEKR